MTNPAWNAEAYAKNFSFVPAYGEDLLRMIDFRGVKSAADLGCGDGALTAKLRGACPDVVGIDASEEMLRLARARHPGIRFVLADVTDFALDDPADLLFSNAVFHWIARGRQEAMLRCAARALRPGGQFVFEFGGHGNNALIHEALAAAFREAGLPYRMPFTFPTIGEYAPLVERAGFRVETALLFPRPTPVPGEDGLLNWLRMFIKKPFECVPDEETAEGIRRRAAESLRGRLFADGTWQLDYVRLRMKAIREG